MASSGNFCVMNSLAGDGSDTNARIGSRTKGNLHTFSGITDRYGQNIGTHGAKTGKWYTEWYISVGGFPSWLVGWFYGSDIGIYNGSAVSNVANFCSMGYFTGTYIYLTPFGITSTSGGTDFRQPYSSFTNQGVPTTGDVIMNCMDFDAGKGWWGINGVWGDSGSGAGDPANGTNPNVTWTAASYADYKFPITLNWTQSGSTNGEITFNAGQDSTFSGAITAGSSSDDNSVGNFKYSVPSGFLALSAFNLPIDSGIDPNKSFMTTANWQGTAGSKTITGVGFKPDLTIIKSADQGNSDWCLFDTNRGVEKLLEPNQTTNEESNSNSLTAFSTDGFTVGSDSRVNGNSYLMTAQCWKANAGTTVTNSDGDIDSTLQANPTAGFSIAEWPSYSGDKKIGHGLSKTPEFIISKLISGGSQWSVFHKDCDSGKSFKLNGTDAQSTQTIYATTFDATTFGLGASFAGSGTGISYIWHSVEGYSSFSKYTGNGDADGPFIFTGHMPRCVWIKRIDSSAEWAVYFWNETTTNKSYVSLKANPLNSRLTFDAGSMNNGEPVDFTGSGFKIRDSDAILNASGGTYIYCSWGQMPFKYNNVF